MTMTYHSKEIWKDIQGYEGMYQVSSHGRVRSFKWNRCKILKTRKDKKGYTVVTLTKHSKNYVPKVHRLVAIAFIPNPNNLPQVNHKDEDKSNNNIDNLEWCTNEYNRNYGTRNERAIKKMIETKGRKIMCITTGEIFNTIAEASKKYNLPSSNLINCCKGINRLCGGMEWKYYDS